MQVGWRDYFTEQNKSRGITIEIVITVDGGDRQARFGIFRIKL
jgi:hypothetical protein